MNCVFYSLIKFPSVAALGNMVLKSGTALQSVKNVWWGMVCGGKKKVTYRVLVLLCNIRMLILQMGL